MTATAPLLGAEVSAAAVAPAAAPRVLLFDPFCFTPWYTAELALALRGAGLTVDLLSAAFAREPDFFGRLGLRPDAGPVQLSPTLHWAPPLCRRVVRTAEVLLHYRALARRFRQRLDQEPAVLHLQQTPLVQRGLPADRALINAARAAGVPVVHTVHNVLPHDSGDRLQEAYRALYRQVDHLICHSESAADAVAALSGVGRDRISVIPHGPLFAPRQRTSQADLDTARERLGLPRGRFVVLFQGILAPYKGLDVLLDAWTICLERCRRDGVAMPLLLVAGSGPDKLVAETRARCAPLGDGVRADLRYLPTAELPQYFAASNVLVYPYRKITTSGALLSGLSYDKPIVSSDLPAFAELLTHGENALLVPPGDAAALASALFTLARDYAAAQHRTGNTSGVAMRHTTLARLAAQAQRNRARCTSWTAIGERTAALYRQLSDAPLRREM